MARVLVANDNDELLDCCRLILELGGHVVETVRDGAKAVRFAQTWQPDAMVIDWVMPNMDGPTAIAALRAQEATARLPILLMSGTDGGDVLAAAIGADAFLGKPFRSEQLLAGVNDLLAAAAWAAESLRPV